MTIFTAVHGERFNEESFNTLDTMPKGVEFHSLDFKRNKELKRLPKNLRVNQTLDLTDSSIEEIGEGLSVGLKFLISGTKLVEIPAHSYIANLVLHGTKIKKIGGGSTITFLNLPKPIEFNNLTCKYLRISDEQSEVAKP